MTEAKVVFIDRNTPQTEIDAISMKFPDIKIVDCDRIYDTIPSIDMGSILASHPGFPNEESIRCIIFTSGTTGVTI